MHQLLKSVMFFVVIVSVHGAVFAESPLNITNDNETYKIGLMVEDIQASLNQRDSNALETISLYGTDSRYYSMIRGWLFQELVSVESQLYASKSPAKSAKFEQHSAFLKKAIRLIDLE